MTRQIDFIDNYLDDLVAALPPGASVDDVSFTRADVNAYLNAHSGYTYTMIETGQLLQDHKRAQLRSNPPDHAIYSRARGADATWGIGTPESVPFINQTAISRATSDATNRLMQCAVPAAASDALKVRQAQIVQRGLDQRMTELGEIMELMAP